MTTGERIKAARKNAGMTQAELADKLGIPYQSIGQWERNQRNPKLETLRKIAAVLGCEITGLLDPAEYSFKIISAPDTDLLQQMVREVVQQSGESDSFYLSGLHDGNSVFITYASDEKRILTAFNQLNPAGQTEAVKRVEELTEIPRYQRGGPGDPEAEEK